MTLELLLQYITYAAIIVVGILILGFIKRATKLPTHAELKKRLTSLCDDINEFIRGERDKKEISGYVRH